MEPPTKYIKILISSFTLVAIGIAIYDFAIRDYLIERDPRYTIGKSIGLKVLFTSSDVVEVKYEVDGNTYIQTIPQSEHYSENGDLFLVKFSVKYPSVSNILFRYRINKEVLPPDSGWKTLDEVKKSFE